MRDEQILDGVRAALAAEPRLLDADIEVSVVDGVVELAGTTDDHFHRTTALREASAVAGVRAVVDEIRAPARVPAPHSTLWPMRPVLGKGSLQ